MDWAPRVDIAETDKEIVIKAEIPEVNRNDVKVFVDTGAQPPAAVPRTAANI